MTVTTSVRELPYEAGANPAQSKERDGLTSPIPLDFLEHVTKAYKAAKREDVPEKRHRSFYQKAAQAATLYTSAPGGPRERAPWHFHPCKH